MRPGPSTERDARSRSASIRAVMPALSWTIGALALTACVLLAVLTTVMRSRSRELAYALDHVRAAQRIELLLVTRAASADPLRRSEDAGRLLAASDELTRASRPSDGNAHVADVRDAITQYLALDADPGANGGDHARPGLDAALMATRRLYEANLVRAQEAELDVARTDDVADLIGVSVATALLLALIAAHVWQRRRVLSPILDLSATMARYASGDHAARARVDGAAELGAMASTFNALASALEEARRNELRYVASTVHDLRDPLAAMQLAVGFVSPDRPLPPENQLRRIFEVIRRQMRILSTTASDVFEGATIEAGELTLDVEERDVRAIVEESVALVATEADAVDVHLPPSIVRVRWDAARMRHVLDTLLRIALARAPGESPVDILVRAEGDRAIVSVTAAGTPKLGLANGLGPRDAVALSAAKKIVDAHGGTLDARRGSFELTMPLDVHAVAEEAPILDA